MSDSQFLMSRRIAGGVLLILALVELTGIFSGPLSFVRRPTVVLAPIHAPGADLEDVAEVRRLLEREIAASGYALYPKSLIENFYLERDNATGVFNGSYRSRNEAFELGEALGVERIAIAFVMLYPESLSLTLAIHDIATDQLVVRAQLKASDMDGLRDWRDEEDRPLDLQEVLDGTVPGMSAGAWLFLFWLCAAIPAGILLMAGSFRLRRAWEWLLGTGVLLALFSWIYALNGDMDYVQRFVATSGILNLSDTAAERHATLWRYLPMFLVVLGVRLIDLLDARRMLAEDGWVFWLDELAPAAAGVSALMYALALPNLLVLEGLPFLAWAAVFPLYTVLRRVTFGRGVGLVLFFVGLQALLVNWWQGTFSYVSLPFTVALSLVQHLPFALILTLLTGRCRRFGFLNVALFWAGWDWIRSLGFLGYPWGILGMSQYANPALIQAASAGGVWLVSAMPHLTGAMAAWSLDRVLNPAGRSVSKTGESFWNRLGCRAGSGQMEVVFQRTAAGFLRAISPLVISTGCVLLIWAAGAMSLALGDARQERALAAGELRQVRILAVQQNTDPRKHDYHLSFSELSRLTDEAMEAEGPFDLTAWPESGFVPDVRFWLDDKRASRRRGRLVREFLDWQKERGIPLVTGTQDHFYELEPDESANVPQNVQQRQSTQTPPSFTEVKRIRNSAMYLGPNRRSDFERSYYYKMRLVPFTENFPYRKQFPKVAELLHNFSTTQWTPGTDRRILAAPGFRFATPICFEDVFPNHMRKFALGGAEVFVNMSNDYWANTPLEGYQHAAHAIFRTVESRRPMVRATCSGWTIAVDASGRISSRWPPFYQSGWTVGEFNIPQEAPRTLYMRLGDWFPVLCLILCPGLLIYEWLRSNT